MLVYGIRCAPADLMDLPADAEADYYMDYGLLVFPAYTRTTAILSHGRVNDRFWAEVKRTIEEPGRVHWVEQEHPFITEEESAVVKALQQYYPHTGADWYYVPRVA